nr:hypothetical protein [Tanacetum cinerariifolium]GEX99234.1 hypothetical protein [Tanacetum cinerariifolium]
MAFGNFMFADNDEEMSFLPREPSLDFSAGSPSASINNEPLFLEAKILDSANPEQLVKNTTNSEGSSARGEMLAIGMIKGECDVLKEWETTRDKECKELKAKCEATMADFDKNLVVNVLRQKIKSLSDEENLVTLESKDVSLEVEKGKLEVVEATLRQEIKAVKCDRVKVVLKVAAYLAMELVHSNEMAMLVRK